MKNVSQLRKSPIEEWYPTKANSVENPTQVRDTREQKYNALDQTNFEKYREELSSILQEIAKIRLIQNLGKFKPKQQKQELLVGFKNQLDRLHRCLHCMVIEAQLFRKLTRNRSLVTVTTATHLRMSGFDYDLPFGVRIKTNMRDLEIAWSMLFQEGSLKHLDRVVGLLRLDGLGIKMQTSITKECSQILQLFELSKGKKSGVCGGCCGS